MGQRYATICRHLGYDVMGHDRHDAWAFPEEIERASHIILATPTKQHLTELKRLFEYDVPILCEKPFTTNYDELCAFEDKHRPDLAMVQMVNQYEFMLNDLHTGHTSYDYFKTGGDGLYWDCINIVGLAKGSITLNNKSPIWACKINGRLLHISDMDYAYISMIREFIRNPRCNYSYAKEAHRKVAEWDRRQNQSSLESRQEAPAKGCLENL